MPRLRYIKPMLTPEQYRRKADQEYEMAGCARQDNDIKDSDRRIRLAKLYMKLARQWA